MPGFNVLLSPCKFWYNSTKDHILEVGIIRNLNMWDKYLSICNNIKNDSLVQKVNVSKFLECELPFSYSNGPKTNSSPFQIPKEYYEQSESNKQEFLKIYSEISITSERAELCNEIKDVFVEWLKQSGKLKIINDLFKLEIKINS